MDSDDLEKLLESAFDEDSEDIVLPSGAPLPCKLLWIVSDGSYVTADQIIAILTPTSPDDGTPNHAQPETSTHLIQDTRFENVENLGDVAQNNLILKSTKSGRLVRIFENMAELTSADQIPGRIIASYCTHDVVVHGLCATCSAQVETGFKRKFDESQLETECMLLPGFITNQSGLEINSGLAYEMECSEISSYLEDRKLCLVLDLDNTLVHATSQKPPADIDIETIEIASTEWNNRMNYVQYVSEEDAEGMRLQHTLESCVIKTSVYNESETTCCNSFFKLRPGIFEFFRKVSKQYRLFLFTMGTRQHAQSALRILDPQGVYFGNRVFSRNDSKSSMKSLDRIFPRHKNLVLILDDSEYVWTDNLGLIKVHPYYFFSDLTYLGKYDLNNLTKSSAALQSICNHSNFVWSKITGGYTVPTDRQEPEKGEKVTPDETDSNGGPVRDDEGFLMPGAIKRTLFRYNGYLVCNERPPDIYKSAPAGQVGGLLKKISIKDNDMQLLKLVKVLENVHKRFFEEYEETLASARKGSRGSAGASLSSAPANVSTKYLLDKDLLPKASMVLKRLREGVLRGVVLYSNTSEFFNVNPPSVLREEPDTAHINFLRCSDFGSWAAKFGASISTSMAPITHLVVNNANTLRHEDPDVKKVHIKWLEAVIYCHELVPEAKFNPDLWTRPFRSFWDVLAS